MRDGLGPASRWGDGHWACLQEVFTWLPRVPESADARGAGTGIRQDDRVVEVATGGHRRQDAAGRDTGHERTPLQKLEPGYPTDSGPGLMTAAGGSESGKKST